jgi:hypothetical protein
MKFHKQTKLKAALMAAAAGLMVAFFGLVRADPGVKAEAETPPPAPALDYGRFFAPDRATTPAAPVEQPPVHSRSRAS